jgi:hypothetical protein
LIETSPFCKLSISNAVDDAQVTPSAEEATPPTAGGTVSLLRALEGAPLAIAAALAAKIGFSAGDLATVSCWRRDFSISARRIAWRSAMI